MASLGMPLFLIADSTDPGKKSFANEPKLCVINTKPANTNRCLLNCMHESYSLISTYVYMVMVPRQSFLILCLSESEQCINHKKEGDAAEVSLPEIARRVWPALSHCLV